jgi:hypothetical protein
MRRVLIAVEGQTEERFVKDVLSPHLHGFGLKPIPTLLRTKNVREGGHFKGGLVHFRQVEERVKALLRDSSAVLVTTIFDYYGPWRGHFLSDYRGGKTLAGRTPHERVEELEREMEAYFSESRFKAFLMLHEFEALLFSRPAEIALALNQPAAAKELTRIRDSFRTPEDIDDHPETAPSRRILNEVKGYQKPAHGALIAGRIGLDILRKECPHFEKWLMFLERLGET